MYKKIILLSFIFLLVNCKNEDNCQEKFQDLYLKRYSLWMALDRNGLESNNNFSKEQFKTLKTKIDDSLKITIDCALENDNKNEILYLYKMKQLYLSNNLDEVHPFLELVDRKIVKDDIYFQLQLYSTLCKELLTKQKPVQEYKTLLNSYSPKLNLDYKDRAIVEFLNFLIDNNIEQFKSKLVKKYPTSSPKVMQYEKDREMIIKDVMMRGDNMVFD